MGRLYGQYVIAGIVAYSWAAALLGQAPDTLWTRTYGGTNADAGRSVQHTSDGGYVVVGNTASFGSGLADVYLVKTDSNGELLWSRTYGGTNWDIGCSVRQTLDGGYVVAGHTFSYGAGLWDVYLVKTDKNGDTLWTRTYGGTDWDYGYAVQQTADSGYIIAGETWSFGGGRNDVYLIKTDASGNALWTQTYGDTQREIAYSVQQTEDGGYIVVGETISFGAGRGDVYLIKTDASGDSLWTKTYGDTWYESGASVRQTSSGGYIVVGETWSFSAGRSDVYLVKTDANGSLIWAKSYGDTNYDYGSSVRETRDGGFIIAGSTWSFGAGLYDVYFLRVDANGDTTWTLTCGGPGNDASYSVDTTSDGGYVAAGWTDSFGAGANDVYLVRTEPEVGAEEPDTILSEFPGGVSRLEVFPNPFSDEANIRYYVGESIPSLTKGKRQAPGFLELKIYDATGKLAKSLWLPTNRSSLPASMVWDGRDDMGRRIANGTYFVCLRAGDLAATRRIVLLR